MGLSTLLYGQGGATEALAPRPEQDECMLTHSYLPDLNLKCIMLPCKWKISFNHYFSRLYEKGTSNHFSNFLLQFLILLSIFAYLVINYVKNKANSVWMTFSNELFFAGW